MQRIIYSAGVPRSGSTLLFNILRITLEHAYKDKLATFWIEDLERKSCKKINLIKTHHLNKIDMMRSYCTFYSYRDIRDVLVSRLRKFGKEPTIEIVRYHINMHQLVKEMGCYTVRYESMIADIERTIRSVVNELKLEIDPLIIKSQLPDPSANKAPEEGHDEKTLFHKGHITGTKQREWEKILSKELQDQIHREFEWWFKENGYTI